MFRLCVLIFLCVLSFGCSAKVRFELPDIAAELGNHEIGKAIFDPQEPLLKKRAILICSSLNISLARKVCQQLAYLDEESSTEPIKLLINSGGGDGTAFLSITNMINSVSAPVDTINIGLCGSTAATLVQSATGKRYAMENTAFLLHDYKGSPEDLRSMYSQFQEEIYKSRCELPKDWLPLKNKEYVFSAEDAQKYKFVDEVISSINY